jgi:hypothetical protein
MVQSPWTGPRYDPQQLGRGKKEQRGGRKERKEGEKGGEEGGRRKEVVTLLCNSTPELLASV